MSIGDHASGRVLATVPNPCTWRVFKPTDVHYSFVSYTIVLVKYIYIYNPWQTRDKPGTRACGCGFSEGREIPTRTRTRINPYPQPARVYKPVTIPICVCVWFFRVLQTYISWSLTQCKHLSGGDKNGPKRRLSCRLGPRYVFFYKFFVISRY